jgi:flagellar hook-associated protein 1
MSLSSSLANALTGLTAASRGAAVISSNVANATTPGYARRELHLSAAALGGYGAGVRVDGVTRAVTQPVLNDRRVADAESGNADLRRAFLDRIEATIGDPGEASSLGGRYAALESALVSAASRPDSGVRLQEVLTAAGALTGTFNRLNGTIQTARMEADAAIARDVAVLNTSLQGIADLNVKITGFRALGQDVSALMDQRQTLVDRVAEIVPVREMPRAGDQIGLYTTGGAILLESQPQPVGFTAVGVITADMTITSGALSGLTLGTTAMPTTDPGPMGGGRLGALFAVRDGLAADAQAQVDALARDLIERFQPPGPDMTLAPGQPGLFTDAGAVVDPLTEAGLSGRVAVSALADPARGGALWRLRDGLGATTQGNVGDATLLQGLNGALTQVRLPASGAFGGAARSAAGLAGEVLSGVSLARQVAEDDLAAASTRQAALSDLLAEDGVDTDAEMQRLLLIEQAFSANARVIQTVDDLIRQLIGL